MIGIAKPSIERAVPGPMSLDRASGAATGAGASGEDSWGAAGFGGSANEWSVYGVWASDVVSWSRRRTHLGFQE